MNDRESPTVSLIVLNWNGQEYLEACMTSLLDLDYPDPEIVMVDNGSTDNSVSYVSDQFPSVRIIETGRNLGYAGGMNVGISRTNSDIVVLLNNDIIVEKDWLTELVRCMESDKRIGIAGCKVFFADNKRLQHAGGYVSLPLGLPNHYGYREEDNGDYDAMVDVQYVTGAAMAIRRPVLDQLNGMDAGFFPIYFEDVDICFRAREKGWRVVYAPESRLVHLESATMVRDSYSYLLRFHQGRMRFLLKHLQTQEFLEGFVPEEMERISTLTQHSERKALKRAYRSALRMLPTIYGNRIGYNQETFALFQQVSETLVSLDAQLR